MKEALFETLEDIRSVGIINLIIGAVRDWNFDREWERNLRD